MYTPRNAEACISAIEAACNVFNDISHGNYLAAFVNFVQLAGWVRSAF